MGNKRMFIIPGGMIECDLANMVAMPALADADNRETVSRWVKSPVYYVLIENEEGPVLFDTGCHPKAMTDRWDMGNRKRTPVALKESHFVVNALLGLGYRPDDIPWVVVSHLHEDHAGGLEFFQKSRILVSDQEFTQTMRMYGLGRTSGGYIKKDIEAWLAADLNWETMDEEEEELYPGIRVLNFGPGHAYGMMGLLVTLPGSGNYIVASDAVNTAMNYGPPMQYPGLAYDTRGFERTIDRIRKLENRYHAQVLFSHDIDQYETYRKAPLEWYE